MSPPNEEGRPAGGLQDLVGDDGHRTGYRTVPPDLVHQHVPRLRRHRPHRAPPVRPDHPVRPTGRLAVLGRPLPQREGGCGMTAPCSCCTCQGVDRPTTGWRPLGMLGEHLVETCPALDCDTFTIHPADGRDALSWILDRLTELGCDPQPVGGAA